MIISDPDPTGQVISDPDPYPTCNVRRADPDPQHCINQCNTSENVRQSADPLPMKPTRERRRRRSAATAPTRIPIDRSLERGWRRR